MLEFKEDWKKIDNMVKYALKVKEKEFNKLPTRMEVMPNGSFSVSTPC